MWLKNQYTRRLYNRRTVPILSILYFCQQKLTPKNRYSVSILELAYLYGLTIKLSCKQKKLLSLSHCAFRPPYSDHQLIDSQRSFHWSFSPISGCLLLLSFCPQSTHRVAMASTFWRTFHHDGKISPAWRRWGLHAHPLSLYLPSLTKLRCML